MAILQFVDDMFLVGDGDLINNTIDKFASAFKLNDLGKPTLFLGI